MRRIFERWYNVFGYEIHIRVVPKHFKDGFKTLANLIHDGKWSEFDCELEKFTKIYDINDPDIIRLLYLKEFMEDDLL